MSAPGGARVAVITGANEGIGLHLARALLENGWLVACLDVEGSNVRQLAESFPDTVRYYDCDVTSTGDVEGALEGVLHEWDHVDVLVNNAAVFTYAPFGERSLEDTREAFEVNYFGYVRMIRAVLPHMRACGEGIIHNVTSGAGRVGHPGLTGYASTEGAIEGLTRSLQLELRREDVSCTLMYPPLTNTRSAATIGYPASLMSDPADVGRKLASKIESTGPIVAADWQTRIGQALAEQFPILVRRGTERFLDPGAQNAE